MGKIFVILNDMINRVDIELLNELFFKFLLDLYYYV